MNQVTRLANDEIAPILDRSDREIILLALAELAKARPGWNPALGEIAEKLDPVRPLIWSTPTAREIFERFRDGEDFYRLKEIERALDGGKK
jgi:hypothetical protein